VLLGGDIYSRGFFIHSALLSSAEQRTNNPSVIGPNPVGAANFNRILMNFGDAIEALKHGQHVSRAGWNGNEMFLFLLPSSDGIPTKVINDPALRAVIETAVGGNTFDALGSIRMFTADKKVLTGWLASQTDMLAEDWNILGLPDVLPPIDDRGQEIKGEIVSPLKALQAGVPYTPGKNEYVITDSNSINDVIRYLFVRCGGGKQAKQEILFLTAHAKHSPQL
jgi:hypothetical protein